MSITPSYDFHPYIYNNQITEHRDDLVTEFTEPNERKCKSHELMQSLFLFLLLLSMRVSCNEKI